ncbi:transmembrane protein, putative (macronuclear) [Tetrahymena thermophila SB210]|uniref:Transmembrane protein, putative n=1 Tax=Tetrahymena thermophila (strain SB210) TaxID=312017 RepID=Q235N4_TETTS|nr:transmembrane protein, putative [Tetrahymena thermophila SB210]EAR92246.3 transmembrane protein, putative [Tetrahymena thermophila SB210]|eukprot:XP_001012491.3 transmembrane protein, putative [Tetrahymena thermophila SB210]
MSTYMLLSNIELVSFVTYPVQSDQISLQFWEPIKNVSYGSIQMQTNVNQVTSLRNLIGIKKYFGYDYAFIYLVSETVYLFDLTNYQQQQFKLLSSFSIDQLYNQYGMSNQIQQKEKFFSGLLISYNNDLLRVTTFDTNGNNFVLKFPKIYNNNTSAFVISYYFNQSNWNLLANNPQSQYIYIINELNYAKYYIGDNQTIQRSQQFFSQQQSSYIASKLVNFDGEESQVIIFNQINNVNQVQIADKFGNKIDFFNFDIYTQIPQISFSFQEVVNLEKIQFCIKINSTQLLVFDANSKQISYFNVSLGSQFNWNNQPEFYQVIYNPQTNQTYFYIVNGLTKKLSRVKLDSNNISFQKEVFDSSKNILLSPGFSVFTQEQIAVAFSSNQIIEYDLNSLQLKSFKNKGYSLDPSTIELNRFLVFQSKYNVLGLQFTNYNNLFINTDQQNIQFDAFGCLQNNQCAVCELQVYFDSSQQNQGFVDSFGLGDLNYQFTTYQNFILGFLQANQLFQFVKTIQTVQIHYFINNSNEMQIDQNQIDFPIKEKIILIIEPVQVFENNSLAVVNISGDFSLSKSCSLNLINIQSISVIDNVIIAGGSEQDYIFCFNFKIQKSNVEFKNLNLQGLYLSNNSSMFTAFNQEQFSLFVSESFTNLILEDINIINNNSTNIISLDQQTPLYLFQSSSISIKNMRVSNNIFYNINIINIQSYIQTQEIQMEIYNVFISDNILNQIQSNFFMQALYDDILVPIATLDIQNIIVSNNSLPNDISDQYLFDINMFQIQKFLNISIQNISLINNHNFGLGLFRQTELLDINNFNCSFTNNYQNLQIPSSSCLMVEDASLVNIQNFIVGQKILNDSFALCIISSQVASQVLIENIILENISIFQSGMQVFSEPIYINLNIGQTVQINNLKASNCSLFGLPYSSVSTPVLYVLNLRGFVNIYQANLQGIFSNSMNNGLVINANSLNISSSIFKGFYYIENDTLNQNNAFYNLSSQTQIIGSCFYFVGTQLNIQNSQFNETQSYQGGFGYLQNLIHNQINFQIINSTFSNSATNFQGSIFYINLSTESYTNTFKFQQLTFKNIYGNLNNLIFNFYNAQLLCNNITIVENNSDDYINDFVQQQFLQFVSIFSFLNSYAELQNIFLSQIITINQITQSPLLIYGEQNSIINLKKCQISNSLFANQGLIFLNNSVLQSSDITIKNMTFAIPYRRQLQQEMESKIFLNSYFIQITSSNVFLNQYNVSFFKCKTCYGGFINSQNSSLTIIKSTFQNLQGSMGGAIFMTDNQNTLIQDCIFEQLQAYYNGGAFFIQNQQADKVLTLRNIKCQQNISNIGKGGCIYIEMAENDQNILIENSQIEQNYAQIGGGISFSNTSILYRNNTIRNNYAKCYGNNIFFAPSYIEYNNSMIDKNADIKAFKDLLIINNVQSGFNIHELKFLLKDDEGQLIFYDKNSPSYIECLENPLTIVQIFSNSSYNIIGSLESQYDDISQQFIFSNITITAKKYAQINLIIKTNLIKTINQTNNQIKDDYYFNVTIQISDCQIGYTPQIGNNGIPQCIPCKDGSYSFNSVACLKCPIGGNCIKYEKDIRIQDGYWRLNQQDDDIILCQNKIQNCIARNHSFSGNDICKRGYVGALCESCDYYGEKWGQKYIKTGSYQCALCQVAVYNIFKLILIYLGIILSVAISIRSYINQIRKFILCLIVIKLSKRKKAFKDQSHSGIDVILKIIGTYIQSIFAISQLQINFPNNLIQFQLLSAMPVSETSYDFDCGLLQLNSKIPISYLRLFFSFIIPIVFLVGYIIIALVIKICSSNSKIRFPKHSIVPALLLIILYTQPNFLYQLVLLGSCRKIGSQYYTNENSNLKCYDEVYNFYTLNFVVPLTILVSFIIPLIFFVILFKNRKNLNNPSFLIKFGFLYKEYKSQFYFWEFIKIIQKTIIMVVLSYFQQLYATKGYLVLFTILIYQALCFKLEPYKKPEINQLDFMQASVCSFSIFISLSILQNQIEQIKYMNILIMIGINVFFIYRVIYQILKQLLTEKMHKLSKYYYKYSFLKKVFKFLNIHAPPKPQKLKRIFETNQQLKEKVKESLIKIKDMDHQDRFLIYSSYKESCNNKNQLNQILAYSQLNFHLFLIKIIQSIFIAIVHKQYISRIMKHIPIYQLMKIQKARIKYKTKFINLKFRIQAQKQNFKHIFIFIQLLFFRQKIAKTQYTSDDLNKKKFINKYISELLIFIMYWFQCYISNKYS